MLARPDPLAQLLLAAATGRLVDVDPLRWRDNAVVTVVVAAENYPAAPRTGDPIDGLTDEGDTVDAGEGAAYVLHAGTALDDDGVPRVSWWTGALRGRDRAHVGAGPPSGGAAVGRIELAGSHHRTDIARRAIDGEVSVRADPAADEGDDSAQRHECGERHPSVPAPCRATTVPPSPVGTATPTGVARPWAAAAPDPARPPRPMPTPRPTEWGGDAVHRAREARADDDDGQTEDQCALARVTRPIFIGSLCNGKAHVVEHATADRLTGMSIADPAPGLPGFVHLYSGKVRDLYAPIGDDGRAREDQLPARRLGPGSRPSTSSSNQPSPTRARC